VVCILGTAACSGDDGVPALLVDGSPARATRVDLEGVEVPAVATRVDRVSVTRVLMNPAEAKCLASGSVDPGEILVRRVGVHGESVTYRTAAGPAIRACDKSSGSPRGEPWCGFGYGRLEAGRVTDPRLDLACATETGDPVAFAWVEPRADAAFVAIRQRGYVEIYPAAGDLPVRVATTTGIGLEESRATFEISEHNRRGTLLRAYVLDAPVAG
jgi:hypothetical protein